MTMYQMTDGQFQTVYNVLSFSLASMMASTVFFWLRMPSIHEKYKAALAITSLVTFIAAYHYFRIFNSWTEAYTYLPVNPPWTPKMGTDPVLTGVPFNDAYRYMDWLLTVPLLLIEIVLCCKLTPEETSSKSTRLGVAAALMIIIGYPGELITDENNLSTRWGYWVGGMIPFAYVVYTLLVGLRNATESEEDPAIAHKLKVAQWATIISWLTYPIVYIIPMMGVSGASAVVGIQVGYCISDVISKCGVGLIIYNITLAKSKQMRSAPDGYESVDGRNAIQINQ
jgi:bacteriorhodopsin